MFGRHGGDIQIQLKIKYTGTKPLRKNIIFRCQANKPAAL
jgi:hypothetical protein